MTAKRLKKRAETVQTGVKKKKDLKENEEDRHSRSSVDAGRDRVKASPYISRRARLWSSFKKKTDRLRSNGSKDKPSKKSKDDSFDQNATIDNDVTGNEEHRPDLAHTHSSPSGNVDFDVLFDDALRRQGYDVKGNDTSPVTEPNGPLSNGGGVVGTTPVSEAGEVMPHSREHALRSYPFFQLDVLLKEGRELAVRDASGTSDPYVKFKVGNKQYYKSRIIYKNLNPKWNEKFTIPIEDPFKPVDVKAFDRDRGTSDDPLGAAEIDLTTLDLHSPKELKLNLMPTTKSAKAKNEYMGYLLLQVTLIPKTMEEKEQYLKKNAKVKENKTKLQLWSSVVNIVLVEGKNLTAMDDNGLSDPYVKFRLGDEKYKSKYKQKTLDPRWLEQFFLYMYDDQTSILEISVWDYDVGGKDDIMGRSMIDLTKVEREVTHTFEQKLEDDVGIVKFLLTISGTAGAHETASDLASITTPVSKGDIVKHYGVPNSFKNIKDIGWLQVKVLRAQGLSSADVGGKSDPFCVIELVNNRLQTHTEYKTLFPEWEKVFNFKVLDIHSILEVSVYDEDREKKMEFLGKVTIPIIKIKRGEKRWYQLKDKKAMVRVKGAVQLEMDLVFNHFKAAIRTFNPREEKYMQEPPKFKVAILKRNIDRVSKLGEAAMEGAVFMKSCFDWESKPRSIMAMTGFIVVTLMFELYMLPLGLLIPFIFNLIFIHIAGNLMKDKDADEYVDEANDLDDDKEKEKPSAKTSAKEDKKSFKEKLQAIQDICLQVQEGMDMVASMGERVKNTFNWTIPWLSALAVTLLSLGVLIFYYIPLRYLILAFGINKFTKKLRSPNSIPNNEILDYLSRVPSDKELMMYRELRPDDTVGTMKHKKHEKHA